MRASTSLAVPWFTRSAVISVIVLWGSCYPLAAQSGVTETAVEGRTQELEKDIDRELSDLVKGGHQRRHDI